MSHMRRLRGRHLRPQNQLVVADPSRRPLGRQSPDAPEGVAAVTNSIVARDKKTGEFGVAVQSHYFQVGPVVPWALAGVGVVATQSQVNIAYGPLGIELLQAGYTAEQALKALTAGDPHAELRPCAMVDSSGNVAAHTGSKCIPAAGHKLGGGF